MTEGEFWDSIEHSNEDVSKGEFFIKYRGLDAHIHVLNYLLSLKSDKVTYSEIATTFRYDKRIRRIIYKYIGFFEEYLRAYIVNKYRENINGFSHINKIDMSLKDGSTLYDACDSLLMSQLINQIEKLDSIDKQTLFPLITYTHKSINAIRVLRNQVSHNRFLLDNLLLVAPYGVNASLYANVKNLLNYLPNELQIKFIDELNVASINKCCDKEYQTEWNMVEGVAIIIS